MQRFVLFGACLVGACYGKGGKAGPVTGGLTTGAITTAPHDDYSAATTAARMSTPGGLDDHINGVELRGYVAAASKEGVAVPNTFGFTVRQLGEGVQSSIQAGWMVTLPVGSSTVFAKLMFDILSWKRVGEDDPTTLSAFSPTFDVGIAPFGHGVCISTSATWDVHFNEPDRAIVGAYVGLCGGRMKR